MPKTQILWKNGSVYGVTIPRRILRHIEWLPGDQLIVEEMEDRSVRVRKPAMSDFVRVVNSTPPPPRLEHAK